jgi:hypothetical protein
VHWLNCVCACAHYGVTNDKVEGYIRSQGDRLSVNAAAHQKKTCENKQQMLFHTFLFLLATKALKFCGPDWIFVPADKTRVEEIYA